jgi:hypothetical protein
MKGNTDRPELHCQMKEMTIHWELYQKHGAAMQNQALAMKL